MIGKSSVWTMKRSSRPLSTLASSALCFSTARRMVCWKRHNMTRVVRHTCSQDCSKVLLPFEAFSHLEHASRLVCYVGFGHLVDVHDDATRHLVMLEDDLFLACTGVCVCVCTPAPVTIRHTWHIVTPHEFTNLFHSLLGSHPACLCRQWLVASTRRLSIGTCRACCAALYQCSRVLSTHGNRCEHSCGAHGVISGSGEIDVWQTCARTSWAVRSVTNNAAGTMEHVRKLPYQVYTTYKGVVDHAARGTARRWARLLERCFATFHTPLDDAYVGGYADAKACAGHQHPLQ